MEQQAVKRDRFGVAVLGFGTAVGMWTVGYFTHLPGVTTPAPVVFSLLLIVLLAGGWLAGRYLPQGWQGGLAAGLITGLLNLLILGSLIGSARPGQVPPSVFLWLPGALLLSAVLGAGMAALGARRRPAHTSEPNWTALFAWIDAAAILLLILAGGIVTSAEAGLAVVDWPNSFGYNMFLYPLARMTGGIYYEHSHRLLGTLAGLTTIVLAIRLQLTARPGWQRWLGWWALALVVVQGILGGLRVTGVFTLSTSPADVAPSITLAIVHGVLGQLVLGTIAAIATCTGGAWQRLPTAPPVAHARQGQWLNICLVGALLIQLVLGALVRHVFWGLSLHIGFAIVVFALILVNGMRAYGRSSEYRPLPHIGGMIMLLGGMQLLLGLAAYIVVNMAAQAASPPLYMVVLATVHQTMGAIILATAAALLAFNARLRPAPAAASPATHAAPATT
jgi:heme A synthase